MGYKLVLTAAERAAFDWIGNRYAWGKIGDTLRGLCQDPDEYDSKKTLEFTIPEHAAWDILETANEDAEGGHSRFPCTSPEFFGKLEEFCDSIV